MISRQSLAEQTAAHLLRELKAGRWRGKLPGVNRLSVELGVSRETLRAALARLESQGWLAPGGDNRPRMITAQRVTRPERKMLKVAVLLHDRFENEACHIQNMLLQIRHDLEKAGHVCTFAPKCQMELSQEPRWRNRQIERTPADAWVVINGSLELLEWFSAGSLPTIAVGGRLKSVSIAGAYNDVLTPFRQVYRELIAMGHRRITLIGPSERRIPELSIVEQALKEELMSHGLAFGDFNAPDWDPTPEGLDALLGSLFQVTPPTALIVGSPSWMAGVLAYLSRRGLRVPEDVSLISEFTDNTLAWHRPAIAHFTCDYDLIQRRVLRWVETVAKGKEDLRKVSNAAVFVPGESVMPPPTEH